MKIFAITIILRNSDQDPLKFDDFMQISASCQENQQICTEIQRIAEKGLEKLQKYGVVWRKNVKLGQGKDPVI